MTVTSIAVFSCIDKDPQELVLAGLDRKYHQRYGTHLPPITLDRPNIEVGTAILKAFEKVPVFREFLYEMFKPCLREDIRGLRTEIFKQEEVFQDFFFSLINWRRNKDMKLEAAKWYLWLACSLDPREKEMQETILSYAREPMSIFTGARLSRSCGRRPSSSPSSKKPRAQESQTFQILTEMAKRRGGNPN